MNMKISIVDGEGPEIKYLTAGTEQVVIVRDNTGIQEIPHHHFEWRAEANLETVLGMVKRLYLGARYDYEKQGKEIDEESVSRKIVLGKIRGGRLGLHPKDDFWRHENPITQVQDNDISLGLITPHYQLYCHNLSYKTERTAKKMPLLLNENTLKNTYRKPIIGGINRIELFTSANIGDNLAELLMTTSPVFTPDKTTKAILTQKFDQILSQYQKPVKLN